MTAGAKAWECPCGSEPPKRGSTTTPAGTFVSLMQPTCPFCGRKRRDEYPVHAGEEPAGRSTP